MDGQRNGRTYKKAVGLKWTPLIFVENPIMYAADFIPIGIDGNGKTQYETRWSPLKTTWRVVPMRCPDCDGDET